MLLIQDQCKAKHSAFCPALDLSLDLIPLIVVQLHSIIGSKLLKHTANTLHYTSLQVQTFKATDSGGQFQLKVFENPIQPAYRDNDCFQGSF